MIGLPLGAGHVLGWRICAAAGWLSLPGALLAPLSIRDPLGRSALQGGSWNQDLGTTQCGLLTDTVELRLSPPFCRADSAFCLAKILCGSSILAPQELCSICRYAELIGSETSTNPVFISELSCLYVLAKEITRQWFE